MRWGGDSPESSLTLRLGVRGGRQDGVAEGEKITDEAKFNEDVSTAQNKNYIEVVADSGVDLGLDTVVDEANRSGNTADYRGRRAEEMGAQELVVSGNVPGVCSAVPEACPPPPLCSGRGRNMSNLSEVSTLFFDWNHVEYNNPVTLNTQNGELGTQNNTLWWRLQLFI